MNSSGCGRMIRTSSWDYEAHELPLLHHRNIQSSLSSYSGAIIANRSFLGLEFFIHFHTHYLHNWLLYIKEKSHILSLLWYSVGDLNSYYEIEGLVNYTCYSNRAYWRRDYTARHPSILVWWIYIPPYIHDCGRYAILFHGSHLSHSRNYASHLVLLYLTSIVRLGTSSKYLCSWAVDRISSTIPRSFRK